jgi:hypothetical protein
VEVAASINDSRTLYKITKVLSNKNFSRSRPIKDTNGKLLTNPDDQLSRWKSHFEALLSEQTKDANDEEEENGVTSSGTYAAINTNPPTETEIKQAILAMKNNNAAGLDDILSEFLKTDVDLTVTLLHSLLQQIWNTETFPDD